MNLGKWCKRYPTQAKPWASTHRQKVQLNQDYFIPNHQREEKPGTFPVEEPCSVGPLRTEGSVPATVGGLPPDHGGAPVQPTMDTGANTRKTCFPSMFSGTGAAATEKPSASTDKRKVESPDPWAEYRNKSEQYNFSNDSLFTRP